MLLVLAVLSGPLSAQQQGTDDFSHVTKLRWMGPDEPDTYAEYIAAHPARALRVEPLRLSPMRIQQAAGPPRVLVIVESSLQPLIQTKLDRYVTDIESGGYAVDVYTSTHGSAEDFKAFIISQSTDLVGCVLFGDLPCAWFEVENDHNEYGYKSFPCDLFLMDLDGTWGDDESTPPMQSGVYDWHTPISGDRHPEIFLGRIDASRMTGDAEHVQINDYLDKLHEWYSGQMQMTNFSLTYTEDDWAGSYQFYHDITYAFPETEAIQAPFTDRDDYADNRLTDVVYHFIQLACHSSSSTHFFTRGGELHSNQIREIPPRALFYNLFCCSAQRFTSQDFLGGSYIFNPSNTALATIGSTKTGSMLAFSYFYQPLGAGETLGQAFSDWFNSISLSTFDNLCWFYGMTIVGDPMVIPVAGDPSEIVLTRPNGGEILQTGDLYDIEWWRPSTVPVRIDILLSVDSGQTYADTLASLLSGADTSYAWTVDGPAGALCKIRVEVWEGGEVTGSDISDDIFAIQGGPYRYVSTTGSDTYPYSIPAWAATSIQDAVDAAAPGDTVLVEAGMYGENVSVPEPVYLLGGWNAGFAVRDPDLYPVTINSFGSVVSFVSITGEGAGIEGFTISGGTGTNISLPDRGLYGGGIFCYEASAVIKDNLITGCGNVTPSDLSAGGGISCYLGTVTITGNELSGCVAQSGGGIYLYQATAIVTDNAITGSYPDPEYMSLKQGGGICARSSAVTMSGNVVSGNTGYSEGGGIYARMGTLSLEGDTVSSNSSSSYGGGIHSERTGLVLSGAVISGNSTGTGGGIRHTFAQFDMSNTLVASNTASVIGGGVSADSCWGDIHNSTFYGNGGMYAGGNMMLNNSQGCDIRNCDFSGGSPTGFQAITAADIIYQYNNAYGNGGGDVLGITPDGTNMSDDLLCVDAAGGDHHLTLHSPGIDAGDPAVSDPDGSRADIGLFGGPDAFWLQPDLVTGCCAVASDDTAIVVSWDAMSHPDGDFFAVFGDTASSFPADPDHLLGTVTFAENTFLHHPIEGCWRYFIRAVDVSEYAGGSSNTAFGCVDTTDTEAPVVVLVYPAGGETFTAGDDVEIQWIAEDNDDVDSVTICLSRNGGGDWEVLASGEPNDSLYTWSIPLDDPGADSCLVRVEAFDPSLNTGTCQCAGPFSVESYTTGAGDVPPATALHQNYPNPFNGHTTVSFSLEKPGHVSIRIYDTAGRLVRVLVDGKWGAGTFESVWNGRDNGARPVASGVYFLMMAADGFSASRKIVYLR